ncbi:hypothetical protein B0H13DRAFT_1028668 [Mycena leptocephala]|nr:hypothetical protein B0H13DRAFT_1028668 [Mycena leptocephala]
MLSPTEPALAIFGHYDNPVVVNIAESLAGLSGFPVLIRPLSDNPALTLLSRDVDPQGAPVQIGDTAGNNDQRSSDNDGDDEAMVDERTPADSGDGGRRNDDRNNAGNDVPSLNTADDQGRYHGAVGGLGNDGGGDGDGGGPTTMDAKWESQLHRTRVKLRLKLNTAHTYTVTVGYNFKFTINRETEMPIDLEDMTRPLSQPEVIVFVDFKVETRPRETQVDRSYASIGFVAHRRESIIEREL